MRDSSKRTMYQTWANMIARCTSPALPSYKNYGGRGIKVCERWLNSFKDFCSDMGERPFGFTLDRINNDGNYEPSNCRWATATEQARNRQRSRFIVINGIKYHVAELQEKSGVNMRSIVYRASLGWPLEKVLSKDKFYNNVESQKKAVKAHAEMKRAQTHCKYGHELSSDNVYLYQNRRHCRKCRKAMDKYLYYKKERPLSDFL